MVTPIHTDGPAALLVQAEQYAESKSHKSTRMAVGLAMMAGLFIGLAFVFYLTVTTGSTAGWGLTRLMGGLAFSMGLILVVLGGAELFTSTVLSMLARANGKISTLSLLYTWARVYIGNLCGALLLVLIVMAAGLYQLDDGQWGLNALHVAQHKLHHSWLQAFSLGVLCNLLVCLAIWMTFTSQNPLTKAVMVILPVAMFVSTGFEHSVANMFMVPLGMSIATFAPDSFWQAVGSSPAAFNDVNLIQFISANLIPVTLGNIVGGAGLVGMGYWLIINPEREHKTAHISALTLPSAPYSERPIMTQETLTIENNMQSAQCALKAQQFVADALEQLNRTKLQGAPVVDSQNQLVGFFSVQDVLVDLWWNDYQPDMDAKVEDLMRTEVQTVEADQSVIELAQYMSIDNQVLYPVSDAGIATRFTNQSALERAKTQTLSRPYIYPVMKDERLVGVITRADVIRALAPLYGNAMDILPADAKEGLVTA
ncbi:formate transporter FocA [Salinivibrio siamensis]|uniref:Formate transporter FocA n=1 Tax=Salinivibrio siamensis TaxID=414286 RepID=A0ABX3KDQ6_9GAMM|nr:formate transporter FocA [Salinivibrio siamensis]OOE87136.1 formate transporter FocA [Salinivibrio siamensis]